MKRSRELEGNGKDADKQEEGKGMDYWGVVWTLMGRDNPTPPPEKRDLCSQAKPIGNKKALTLCSTAFKAKKQVV